MKPGRIGSTTLLAALALGAAATGADPLFESRSPDRPRLVRAGDFNADGVPDLAIAHALSNQIAILLGDGAGGFRPADSSPFDAPLRPTGLAVMDLDNDPAGGDDLVVVGNRSGTMVVFTTSVPDPIATIPQARFLLDASFLLGFGPASVILAQLDPDGEVDAVVSLTGQDELSILAGLTGGNFSVESNTTVTDDTSTRPTAGPDSLAAGDWDGDGDTDLAVANTREGRIALLLGNGNRTFQAPVFLAPCSGCAVPRGLALGRIDPDPIDDLVVPFSGGICSGGANDGGNCLTDGDCPLVTCGLSERIAIYRGN
ncbi:MAG: FG-GAP repeat domain-containing protein, partial [Actinomycetota bacterium]